MGFKGINVRQTGDRILFREVLKDATGTILASGTTNLYLFEIQSDGTLKSYDFNDNTFKTTALTTQAVAMTHQRGNNNVNDTGIWTYALTTVSGFTAGNVYLCQVANTFATPPTIEREFQYGSAEGDMSVTAVSTGIGNLDSNIEAIDGDATAGTRLKNLFTTVTQGTVDSSTFTPTTTDFETSILVNTDKYTKQAVYFYSGSNAGFTSVVTTYAFTNSKVKLTVTDAFPVAPSNGDGFLIFGKGA